MTAVGLEEVRITRRFNPFSGTNKEHIALKFGVVGVNLSARMPVAPP